MSEMLQLHGVTKRYAGGQIALQDLNLSLDKGEMAFLTGHSGAGKSTLLKLIALLERPSRGRIIVNGVNLSRLKPRHIPEYRQGLGLIFQNYNLLYDRTVFDNVALPLVIRGMRHDDISRRVRAALETVGLLRKERAQPITLSGGEQQRVAIARSVVCKPHVLLADEPTGNLDPELSLEIMRLFGRLNKVGVTILIATHDIDLIQGMGRRIINLEAGQLSESAPVGVLT